VGDEQYFFKRSDFSYKKKAHDTSEGFAMRFIFVEIKGKSHIHAKY